MLLNRNLTGRITYVLIATFYNPSTMGRRCGIKSVDLFKSAPRIAAGDAGCLLFPHFPGGFATFADSAKIRRDRDGQLSHWNETRGTFPPSSNKLMSGI